MSSPDDPHMAREASKYDKPVASREYITQALTDAKEPLSLEDLAVHFEYEPETDEFEGLRRRVGAMQRDGQIIVNRTGGLMPVDESSLVAGRIQAHSDGFGFLIADDGEDDIYLNGKQMRQVLHGDRVVVGVTGTDRRGRREGRIIEVVERAHKTLVGRFMDEQGVLHVSPDNKRIHLDVMIPVPGRNGANAGDIVVVEITEQPTRRNPPVGNVIEVLGPELKAGMEIDVALRSHDIPHIWPDEVTEQADSFGATVRDKDIPGRKDIRNLPLMTIDGADARDFDDAVYAEKTDKGYRLLVAIADVAHYVEPDSALDAEAKNRGTSVYFPGQVVPMLPEVLSNGLCSLNPHVDRLCMLCELTLDDAGGIKRTRFFNAVMKSHARLTYSQAWEMLKDPNHDLRTEHANVAEGLDTLYQLYKVLRAARDKRGVIEFESTETRIVFDENRKIQELLPVRRNDAHKLIEECMILANVATAAFVERQKIPALYRVHHGPKADRLEDLRSFLAFRSLSLGGGDSPSPIDYARLSKSIDGRADRSIIETTMLRSMQQAVYQPKNEGHFGLALNQYAHFTSPIRRYPDLLIHRAIKYSLTRQDIEHYTYSTSDMQVLGESCSTTERRAEEASRDVLSWLKCEYMQSHVGSEFDGVIGTVTSFGLFVDLKDMHVEGLVHITSLVKDYYRFEQPTGALIGEKSGREYHLGEEIRVRVAAVNLDDRKIDFQEVDTGPRVRKSGASSTANVMDPKKRQKKPKKSKSQLRRDKQRLTAKLRDKTGDKTGSKQKANKPAGSSKPDYAKKRAEKELGKKSRVQDERRKSKPSGKPDEPKAVAKKKRPDEQKKRDGVKKTAAKRTSSTVGKSENVKRSEAKQKDKAKKSEAPKKPNVWTQAADKKRADAKKKTAGKKSSDTAQVITSGKKGTSKKKPSSKKKAVSKKKSVTKKKSVSKKKVAAKKSTVKKRSTTKKTASKTRSKKTTSKKKSTAKKKG